MGIAIKALNCDFSTYNIGNISGINITIPSGDLDNTVTLTASLDDVTITPTWSIVQGDSYAIIDSNGVLTMTKWSDNPVEITVKATAATGAASTAIINISHAWHPAQLNLSDFTFFNCSNIIMLDAAGNRNGIRLAPFSVNNKSDGDSKVNYRAAGLLLNTKYPTFSYSSSIKPQSDSGVTDISNYVFSEIENYYSPMIVPKGCTSITFGGRTSACYIGVAVGDLYGENSGNNWIDSGWCTGTFSINLDCSKINEGLNRAKVLPLWLNFKDISDGTIKASDISSLVEGLTIFFNY